MQKISLIALLLIARVSLAQTYTYTPFPTQLGVWKYHTYNGNGTGQGWHTETFRADSTGLMVDSVSGLSYFEQNKKIYITLPNDTVPMLAFDFNLSVGDTFYVDSNYPYSLPTYGVVSSDDSSDFNFPGRRSLTVDFSPQSGSYIWVEGVGTVFNSQTSLIPFDYAPVSGGVFFKCHYADSISFPCSDALNLSLRSENRQEFMLYPNPAKDHIYLNAPEKIRRLQIFDINGAELPVNFNYRNNKLEIDISALAKGEYILLVNGRFREKLFKI